MNKKELVEKLKQVRCVGKGRIMIKEIDYSNNPLSPTKMVYKVFYTDIFGDRCCSTYFGDTLGFQG